MNVLVFAPHNDDEVLGVGGTIAKHVDNGDSVYVCEVTVWKENQVEANRIKNEAIMAHKVLGVKDSIFLDLPVVGLKETPTVEKNEAFRKVVNDLNPEIVYLPHVGDMHIDHYETALAAMTALRPISNPNLNAIYVYETLSETEWNIPNIANAFKANVYSDITNYIDIKLEAMKCYKSQLCDFPHPRSLQAIKAQSMLRGSTVGVNFAEAFYLVRYIF